MIRSYLINKNELEQIHAPEDILSPLRQKKLEKLKRDSDKSLSVCAELLLIYGLKQWDTLSGDFTLPLDITEDERGKLQLQQIPLYFNLSHASDYAVCAISDAPIGVDIEYFRVKELMSPDRILHPEEAQLMAYISNPNEKKKYFYECWVAKESYLKNLGIGLIVRPRDFLVSEDKMKIRGQEITDLKGHHTRSLSAGQSSDGKDHTLEDNLFYLEKRYVHVLEPGEVRGSDWKFDAGYRMAICSMEKDPDSVARLIHAKEINDVVDSLKKVHSS